VQINASGAVYVYIKSREAWELAEDISIDASHKIVHGLVCVFNGTRKAWVAVENFVIDETHKVSQYRYLYRLSKDSSTFGTRPLELGKG
jgi:hypothetical protein